MKTAVCLWVKNESHTILEWILYHVSVGFDTIFVMDNNSDDDTEAVARSAATFHDVRVERWTATNAQSQVMCYNYFLEEYGSEFDWVAFIDADEFVFPLEDRNIKVFLSKFEGYAAVALNWAIFGSGGLSQAPKGFVLESYILRSDERFLSNRHVKSIVRPALTQRAISPYVFHLVDTRSFADGIVRSGYADASGQPVCWSDAIGITARDPIFKICRINHYYTRSRQEFDEKIRRNAWSSPEYAESAFLYNDRNEVRDVSAVAFTEVVHTLADKIRPSVKFSPAKWGSLPNVPFGSRLRDYVESSPASTNPVDYFGPISL